MKTNELEELQNITKAMMIECTIKSALAVMPNTTDEEVNDMRLTLKEMLFPEQKDE